MSEQENKTGQQLKAKMKSINFWLQPILKQLWKFPRWLIQENYKNWHLIKPRNLFQRKWNFLNRQQEMNNEEIIKDEDSFEDSNMGSAEQ